MIGPSPARPPEDERSAARPLFEESRPPDFLQVLQPNVFGWNQSRIFFFLQMLRGGPDLNSHMPSSRRPTMAEVSKRTSWPISRNPGCCVKSGSNSNANLCG